MLVVPKRTYQPSQTRRNRKYGYRSRTATMKGKLVVKRRKLKGRARLTF
ncbi:50S ribosomal protein L34 [Candidatus Woesebacteria bacterium GWB1_43_5]|uniref:Large ribosomal subunit protein bL34 n=1 Tax=Candidatus Woesebacteria bacterium GWB1_43_5 TaxID=1802474 RepID=A0A1F7WRW6_9BACT|nr:MAG: 50S ribosomal protein L34 [Candidatus Woesebacteria bacterium GWB1_43_5]